MATYLDTYGVDDARRSRQIRRIIIVLAGLVVLVAVAYFGFRNYREKQQVSQFLEHLRAKDYQSAYRMWGCEQPCPGYPMERFMEDWGPKSPYGDPARMEISGAEKCANGSVITLQTAGEEESVALWVDGSAPRNLGFSPWQGCNAPRIRVGQ
jgi:hypothetical protein